MSIGAAGAILNGHFEAPGSSAQGAAQSMSKAMQRVMCSMPGSRRQAAAQWLQARAQAWQAWMQRE